AVGGIEAAVGELRELVSLEQYLRPAIGEEPFPTCLDRNHRTHVCHAGAELVGGALQGGGGDGSAHGRLVARENPAAPGRGRRDAAGGCNGQVAVRVALPGVRITTHSVTVAAPASAATAPPVTSPVAGVADESSNAPALAS